MNMLPYAPFADTPYLPKALYGEHSLSKKKHGIILRERQGLEQYIHRLHFNGGSLAKPLPNESPCHSASRLLLASNAANVPSSA